MFKKIYASFKPVVKTPISQKCEINNFYCVIEYILSKKGKINNKKSQFLFYRKYAIIDSGKIFILLLY